jgi:hypothetical protein
LYSLPDIIRLNQLKRIRWAGHATSVVWIRISYKTMIRNSEGKVHLEDLGIDGRVLLKCFITIWWTGSRWGL